MDQTFHIYLNSEASKQTFPFNDSGTFTQLLPERLTLEPQGKWYCRVTSCNAGFRLSKPHYLLCDFCNESIVGQRKKPILCLLHHKVSEIIEPAWVPVKSRELSQIKIRLQRVDNPTTLTVYWQKRLVLLTVYWNLNKTHVIKHHVAQSGHICNPVGLFCWWKPTCLNALRGPQRMIKCLSAVWDSRRMAAILDFQNGRPKTDVSQYLRI